MLKNAVALGQTGACLGSLEPGSLRGCFFQDYARDSLLPLHNLVLNTCRIPSSMLGLQKHPRVAECPPGNLDMSQRVRTPENRVAQASAQEPQY